MVRSSSLGGWKNQAREDSGGLPGVQAGEVAREVQSGVQEPEEPLEAGAQAIEVLSGEILIRYFHKMRI